MWIISCRYLARVATALVHTHTYITRSICICIGKYTIFCGRKRLFKLKKKRVIKFSNLFVNLAHVHWISFEYRSKKAEREEKGTNKKNWKEPLCNHIHRSRKKWQFFCHFDSVRVWKWLKTWSLIRICIENYCYMVGWLTLLEYSHLLLEPVWGFEVNERRQKTHSEKAIITTPNMQVNHNHIQQQRDNVCAHVCVCVFFYENYEMVSRCYVIF